MINVPVKSLPQSFVALLQKLSSGEAIAISSDDGKPPVVLVAVRGVKSEEKIVPEMVRDTWFERWDAMANRIAADWKGDKSALEALTEMRR